MPNRPAIKIIQNRHFLTTTPQKSVCAVAAHMRDNNEGVVLVVGRGCGGLTEHQRSPSVLVSGMRPSASGAGTPAASR